MKRAVVLHSGGQDSTTCLAAAAEKYLPQNVFPLQINYGQRHQVELDCAVNTARLLGVNEPVKVDLPGLPGFGGDALTGGDEVTVEHDLSAGGNAYAKAHGLPSTFVPGRNMLFLSIAASYAAKVGSQEAWTGVCAADEAGYPDCRPQFIADMKNAISSALDDTFSIVTPLLHITKAETFALAEDLGVLDLIIEETHTCYEGEHTTRHSWGYGCGTCGSCLERAQGWELFNSEVGQ